VYLGQLSLPPYTASGYGWLQPTGGPTTQVGWLGLRVGGRDGTESAFIKLIHVNSHNRYVIMYASQTVSQYHKHCHGASYY